MFGSCTTPSHDGRNGKASARAAEIRLRFGLPNEVQQVAGVADVPRPQAGQILFITGPSGSGKSSLLARIDRDTPGCVWVHRMRFPADEAVIDGLAPWAPLGEAIWRATTCGLGEPRLWLQSFESLSTGEQHRARLARALALQARAGSRGALLCDEFTSGLHRRLARAMAVNLRKLCTLLRLSVVVAASQDDFLGELRPDVVLRLQRGAAAAIAQASTNHCRGPGGGSTPRRRWRIQPGVKRDYEIFARMHYRSGEELGFVDRVFVLRDAGDGEALGIVVYAHAALELSLRNQATDGWFSQSPGRVNRHLRVLRRLVIHPDVRGCGLGHYLVRRTLPMLDVDFVECLADMGEFNPVFEKAGMVRIGQYGLCAQRQAAVNELRQIGVDPLGRDFAVYIGRNRAVRNIVAGVIERWYAGTTGDGAKRPARQSPNVLGHTFRSLIGARPVYYLWQRPVAGRRRRKKNLIETCEPATGVGGQPMNELPDVRHGISHWMEHGDRHDSSRTSVTRTRPMEPSPAAADRPGRAARPRKNYCPEPSSGIAAD